MGDNDIDLGQTTNYRYIKGAALSLKFHPTTRQLQVRNQADTDYGYVVAQSFTGNLLQGGIAHACSMKTTNNVAGAWNLYSYSGSYLLSAVLKGGNFSIPRLGDTTMLADKKLVVPASTELTIDTGVITVTGVNNRVDTEGDAASDDLDTINGGENGMIIILRAAHSSRTVTVKHLTVPSGNIQCGTDFALDNEADTMMLMYSDQYAVWLELARNDNA